MTSTPSTPHELDPIDGYPDATSIPTDWPVNNISDADNHPDRNIRRCVDERRVLHGWSSGVFAG